MQGGRRINVTKQKTDSALSAFRNADSGSSKFATTVADNSILRTMFFLQSKSSSSIDLRFPVVEEFPLVLDPTLDIFDKLKRDYSNDTNDTKEKYEKSRKEIRDIFDSTLLQTLDMVITDKEVVSALGKRTPERKRVLDQSFDRHKEEIVQYVSDYVDRLGTAFSEMQVLEDVLDFVEVADDAQANGKILDCIDPMSEKKASFFASLNQLAALNIIKLTTMSLCLDCFFKFREEPYMAMIENPKLIDLPDRCPRCRESGILHRVMVHYPQGLHKIVLPSANWLQEVIMGYSLSSIKSVKRVFIHKKIHAVASGNEGAGVESDVSLITEDGRLILIEVTKQSKMDNILRDLDAKLTNLNEKNIPFAALGYVTGSLNDEFMTYGGDRAKIFAAKHIYKICDFVENELIR